MQNVTPEMEAQRDALFASLDRLQDLDSLPESEAIAGAYGEDALKKAQKLLKAGYYNRIGSDIHRYRQLGVWDSKVKEKWIQRVLEIGLRFKV